MAQIIFDIPDAQIARVIEAFCDTFDYSTYVLRGGTQTQGQFTKARIAEYIRSVTQAHEHRDRLATLDQVAPPTPPPDVS